MHQMKVSSYTSRHHQFPSRQYVGREKVKQFREMIRDSNQERIRRAGFKLTNDNKYICNVCQVEYIDDDNAPEPLAYHYEKQPDCSFIRNKILCHMPKTQTECHDKSDLMNDNDKTLVNHFANFRESNIIKLARRRNFRHWQNKRPSSSEMILAGFFVCNVKDRVMCIYCNLIIQDWSDTDNPIDVHKKFSPDCPFIISFLNQPTKRNFVLLNNLETTEEMSKSTYIELKSEFYPNYKNIRNRLDSFKAWNSETGPKPEDLAKAGFFYTNTRNIVTCFYCGGSLQNWDAKDNPLIEHVRWFEHCTYAKQMAGIELHDKIKAVRKSYRENQNQNAQILQTSPEEIEALRGRHVAARLDSDVAVFLLDCLFKLNVIRRVYDDRLKLADDDFEESSDVILACTVLERQIKEINGRPERIRRPTDAVALNVNNIAPPNLISSSNGEKEFDSNPLQNQNKLKRSDSEDLCLICIQEQRQLVSVPCGHLVTCVPCGYSLDVCPICRVSTKGFVRVYL